MSVERPVLLYAMIICAVVIASIIRAYLDKTSRLKGFFSFLGYAEIGVLMLFLAALVFFGCLQIVLRNFFHRGIIWADPLMRHIVLWLGCLGGAFATRRLRHIGIDVLTRFLPEGAKAVRDRVIFLATAAAASALGIATLELVADEKSFGEKAFLNVDVWILQLILPAAFFLIAYRSVFNVLRPPEVKPFDWEDTTSGARDTS